MDFFDPEKQKRHSIRLLVGYVIIGVVLLLATTILLYRAYGFGLDKDGRVIQNGVVLVSSRPQGADVYMNGKKFKDQTNTHLLAPSGQYVLELKRDGYRDWKRALTVEGGKIELFDYTFLFPKDLNTSEVKQYSTAPSMSSVSLDRRWLLVAAEPDKFDLYDLNAANPRPDLLAMPVEALAAGSTTTGWQLIEWAKDNRHVLLQRSYDKQGQTGSEYILFDREKPELTQNLSVAFGFNPTAIELRDQAYDQYYLFDQNSGQLFTSTLKQPTPQVYKSGVLTFTSEKGVVAYVTAEGAPAGKVLVRALIKDDPPLTVRAVPVSATYLLDMAEYGGKLYLAAGASSENRVFLFKDPIGSLKERPKEALTPTQILKVPAPSYVSFSANKRFVITESGDKFSVYDIETDRGYVYQTNAPLDAPQAHAAWMDGFRLSYVSGGKVMVFDFDGTNKQTLSGAVPGHLPIFDRDYRYLYTLDAQNALVRTALLAKRDM